jgi:hypothetical protein
MKIHKASKSGSALLLTLLVVSLLLVIVLSFTVYVRLELRSIGNQQNLMLARHNAKLAMNLALAQLQKAAGPDQRVTARAEITGDTTKPWKTGVWDTTDMNAGPEWLITEGTGPEVSLVSLGTLSINGNLSDQVKSSLINIINGTKTSGRFAYWVGDEGVKTSLAKGYNGDHLKSFPTESGLTQKQASRVSQITPSRPRSEWFFTEFNKSSVVDDWSDYLLIESVKTTSKKQFEFLSDNISYFNPAKYREELQKSFHQTTWKSFGVLADTEYGGIKKDLSFEGTDMFSDSFMSNDGLRSWIKSRPSLNDEIEIAGVNPTLINEGEPTFTKLPILTEFGLYFAVTRDDSAGQNKLRLRVQIKADLWNPYSFPLEFTPRGQPDFILELTGLPDFNCRWVTAEGNANQRIGAFTLTLDDINLTHDETGRSMDLGSFEIDIFNSMLTGQVRNINEEAQGPISNSLSGDATNTRADDYMWISASSSEVTVKLKTLTGDLLQEFKAIPFPEFNTFPRRDYRDELRSIANISQYQLVYHFRYYDETTNGTSTILSDMERWSQEVDPRSLIMDMSTLATGSDAYFYVTDDPGASAVSGNLFQARPEFFTSSYYRFFDSPSVDPISVGALQHLQFKDTPPFSVGNIWGNQADSYGTPFNSYFDRYFFSTAPQGSTTWNPNNSSPLPNLHLNLIKDGILDPALSNLRSSISSAQFLVEGAFNINSVDPTVWKSHLGSLNLYTWDFDNGKRPRVKNGIFRFPFGADYHYKHPFEDYSNYPEISQSQKLAWYRNEWSPYWATAYTSGMRELRDADLELLSTIIVNKLKLRGTPFKSIRELADSGLLQDAIAETTINTVSSKNYNSENDPNLRIPRYAPSFLSQADILQLIAPFSQTRSDTFLIRSYGDVLDSNGNIASKTVCEAVVQRLPEPLSFSNPPNILSDYNNPPNDLGRRFKIISFKWLENDEI